MVGLAIVAGVAVLIWAIDAAAAAGFLAPNKIVGLGDSAVLSSPEAWQIGHRAALALLSPAGIVVLLASLILLDTRPWHSEGFDIADIVVVLAYAVVLGFAIRIRNNTARQIRDDQ